MLIIVILLQKALVNAKKQSSKSNTLTIMDYYKSKVEKKTEPDPVDLQLTKMMGTMERSVKRKEDEPRATRIDDISTDKELRVILESRENIKVCVMKHFVLTRTVVQRGT